MHIERKKQKQPVECVSVSYNVIKMEIVISVWHMNSKSEIAKWLCKNVANVHKWQIYRIYVSMFTKLET